VGVRDDSNRQHCAISLDARPNGVSDYLDHNTAGQYRRSNQGSATTPRCGNALFFKLNQPRGAKEARLRQQRR
jgi:hypothetical protein